MPTYTVHHNGRELQIDTEHGFRVYPGQGEAVCDVSTWPHKQRVPLTEQQARELADQDFQKRKVRSCANCYFHNRREIVGDCEQICCAVRREALLVGVEVSPHVHKLPPLPVEARDDTAGCAVRMMVGWCLLSVILRSPAIFGWAAGAWTCGAVLVLLARWQRS